MWGILEVNGGEIEGEKNKYEISEVLVGGGSQDSSRGEGREGSGCWASTICDNNYDVLSAALPATSFAVAAIS